MSWVSFKKIIYYLSFLVIFTKSQSTLQYKAYDQKIPKHLLLLRKNQKMKVLWLVKTKPNQTNFLWNILQIKVVFDDDFSKYVSFSKLIQLLSVGHNQTWRSTVSSPRTGILSLIQDRIGYSPFSSQGWLLNFFLNLELC